MLISLSIIWVIVTTVLVGLFASPLGRLLCCFTSSSLFFDSFLVGLQNAINTADGKYGLMLYLSVVALPIMIASYLPAYTALLALGMVGVHMLLYVSFNNLASIKKSPAE